MHSKIEVKPPAMASLNSFARKRFLGKPIRNMSGNASQKTHFPQRIHDVAATADIYKGSHDLCQTVKAHVVSRNPFF